MNSKFRFFSAIWLLIKACLVYFLAFFVYGFLYGLLPNVSDSAMKASSFSCGIIVAIIYVSISSKSDRHMRSSWAIWEYIHRTSTDDITSEPKNDTSDDAAEDLNFDELKNYSEALDQRAAELDQREQNIDKYLKEEALKLRKKILTDSAKIRYDAEEAMDNLEKYKTALFKTEARTLDWVRRREKDDIEAFNEILADVEKFSTYSQQKMTGFEFESHIAELLRGNGFTDVEVTPKSQDFGADIVGCLKGVKYVLQCKYYSSPVGIDSVQQIYSAKMHYDAHVPVVVTNSVFTKAAKILAEEVNVLLWDCETVADMEAKANIKPPLEPSALV